MADNFTQTVNEKTSAERKAAKDIGISGNLDANKKSDTLTVQVLPK